MFNVEHLEARSGRSRSDELVTALKESAQKVKENLHKSFSWHNLAVANAFNYFSYFRAA